MGLSFFLFILKVDQHPWSKKIPDPFSPPPADVDISADV